MSTQPNRSGVRIAAVAAVVVLLSRGAFAGEEGVAFGSFQQLTGAREAIRWLGPAESMRLEQGRLHFAAPPGRKVVFRSASLGVAPLAMHAVAISARRGPGTDARFSVRWKDVAGKSGERLLVFQLPDTPRQGWSGLSPYRCRYVQDFCLPEGARESWVEISLQGCKDADFNYLELFEFVVRATGPVPFGARRGENLIPAGAMEIAGKEGGAPCGWGTWGYKHPDLELAAEDPKEGKSCLRIDAGCRFYLACAQPPFVERGRAYEISFWARGEGDLSVLAHALAETRWYPLPVRVGDAQSKPFRLAAQDWARFTHVWFAESTQAETAQLVFVILPKKVISIDDVQFRLIESD